MRVPPPLLALAAAELRMTTAPIGGFAALWQSFSRGARHVAACDDRLILAVPMRVSRPVAAAEAPRKRRRSTSPKARHRQKVRQHNRHVARQREETR